MYCVPIMLVGSVSFLTPPIQETDIIGLLFTSFCFVYILLLPFLLSHCHYYSHNSNSVVLANIFLSRRAYKKIPYMSFWISYISVPVIPCFFRRYICLSISSIPAVPHLLHHIFSSPSLPRLLSFIPISYVYSIAIVTLPYLRCITHKIILHVTNPFTSIFFMVLRLWCVSAVATSLISTFLTLKYSSKTPYPMTISLLTTSPPLPSLPWFYHPIYFKVAYPHYLPPFSCASAFSTP